MLNFNPKKCLCIVVDCGKCLTLGCTDDNCDTHRIVTKWRYRNRFLESLRTKADKLHKSNSKKELTDLQKDIKICKKEVERLNKIMTNQSKRNYYEEFKEFFTNMSDEELIIAFNREVGNNGWVSARAFYLATMHKEFEKRFDYSKIGDKKSLSFAREIRLIDKKIVIKK